MQPLTKLDHFAMLAMQCSNAKTPQEAYCFGRNMLAESQKQAFLEQSEQAQREELFWAAKHLGYKLVKEDEAEDDES